MAHRYDALCAVIGRSARRGEGSPSLLVEATPDGWWYSSARAEGRVVAALVTDPDLLAATGRGATAMQIALDRAPLTSGLVRSLAAATYTVSACSATLEPVAGEGWLAVGDAAIARDPLSGQGIVTAMHGAVVAAKAVEDLLHGDPLALNAYAAQMRAWGRSYLGARREVYASQTRWTDRPFWRRRTSLDRSDAA
jgi:2-polyprenyl-6-methoxyphenol hydroxylase-like FAD-dependent oxidoreductase